MKYNSIITIILIFCCWVNSLRLEAQQIQSNFVLNEPEYGKKEYLARDYVLLQSGFSYTATGEDFFSAKVDNFLLFPPTANSYALADGTITTATQGGVVGSVPGKFNVSPNGAASYVVPIEVLAGFGGVQPCVNLSYDSQCGNGLLGYGWNIVGLSAISKAPKNTYFDNKISGMIWGDDSPLVLDGQRLIYETNNIYRLEGDVTRKVEKIVNQSDNSVSFKVYTKDGLEITYGDDKSSKSYLCYDSGINNGGNIFSTWQISRIQNKNGAFVEYNYTSDAYLVQGNITNYKNFRISSIVYGHNKLGTIGEVKFDYEKRFDVIQGYVQGYKYITDVRLCYVTVMSHTKQVRKYSLTYDANKTFSSLTKMALSGMDDIKYNETIFDYPQKTLDEGVFKADPVGKKSFVAPSVVGTADFTGDGVKDLYYFNSIDVFGVSDYHKYDCVLEVNFREKANNDSPLSAKIMTKADYITKTGQITVVGGGGVYGLKQFSPFLGDFFANGITSICKCLMNYMDPYKDEDDVYSVQFISLKDGVLTENEFIDIPPGVKTSKPFFVSGEFDGEAGTDVLIISDNAVGITDGYQYTAKMVKKLGSVIETILIKTSKKICGVEVGQYTGSGKSDLLLRFEDSNSLLVNQYDGSNYFTTEICGSAVFVPGLTKDDISYEGYFNQDNLPDFVYRTGTSDWHIAYNKGNGSCDVVNQSFECTDYKDERSSSDKDKDNVYVVDINNDGYEDIVLADELLIQRKDITGRWWVYDKTNWKIYLHTNDGFALSQEFTNSIRTSSCLGYGDLLGDGRNRLLKCAGEGQVPEYFDAGYTDAPHMLSSVTDGMGKKTTIKYRGLAKTEYDYTDLTLESDFYQFRSLDYKMVSVYNDGLNAIKMDYSGAVVDKRGRGFLGFMKTKATDSQTYISSTTTNKLDNTFGILIPQEQKLVGPRGGIKTVSSDYVVKDLGSKRYQLLLKSNVTTDGLTSLTSTQKFVDAQGQLAYDAWGNPKIISTTKGDQIVTQSINYVSRGSWTNSQGSGCDNKISDITTVASNITRINKFVYDTKGNLLQEIRDFGDKNQLTTDYPQDQYDEFGNPRLITVTANGRSQSTKMTYLSGLYLESKTSVELGTTVTYKYDEIRGLKTSQIDEANNTTTFKYDGFGRLNLTISPNNVQTISTLQWAGKDSNKPTGAVFYQHDETSGAAPSVTWYDINGREIRKDEIGLSGKKVFVTTEYNNIGKVWRVSVPFFEGDNATKQYASIYEYDNCGRVSSVVTPLGTTSYNYESLKTTVSSPTGTSSTILNTAGQVGESITNGKSVKYTYWPTGLVNTATPDGGQAVTTEFDIQGNRVKMVDPDAGIITSEYNGWGQLLWCEQRKNVSANKFTRTEYTYSPKTGLLENKTVKGNLTEITTYNYDNLQRVSSIAIDKQHTQSFTYDSYGRVTKVDEIVGTDKKFVKETVYDPFGRISKEIYPTGYYIINGYDQYGNFVSVTDKNGKSIWQATEANASGQLTKTTQGGREISYGYDKRELPSSVFSSNIIDMEYVFDANGNLEQRTDGITSQYEKFAYDKFNRLFSWKVYKNDILTKENSVTYSPDKGYIISKSDIGSILNYGEEGQPPHALTSIEGCSDLMPDIKQVITYTDFNKIATITEGANSLVLTYGVDQQRRKGVFNTNGSLFTRYYFDDYEEEVAADGTIRQLHYISGGNGLAAIYEQKGSSNKLYYCYSDYQGNLLAVTDDAGGLIEQLAYDPWGARRNPDDWTLPDKRPSHLFARGYTMHEHLDAFGLINMNGRAYDPLVAQFMSPDPFVQAPNNAQSYNRYAYCLNNPFMYTDPTGYNWINNGLGGIKQAGNWILDKLNQFAGYMYEIGVPSMGFGVSYSGGAGLNTQGYYKGQQVFNTECKLMIDPAYIAKYKLDNFGKIYSSRIGSYQDALNEASKYNHSQDATDNDIILNERINAIFGPKGISANPINGRGTFGILNFTTKYPTGDGDFNGDYVLKDGTVAAGICIPHNSLTTGSNIYISRNTLYADDVYFEAVVGHEIVHASHVYTILNRPGGLRDINDTEASAWNYIDMIYRHYHRYYKCDFPGMLIPCMPSNPDYGIPNCLKYE